MEVSMNVLLTQLKTLVCPNTMNIVLLPERASEYKGVWKMLPVTVPTPSRLGGEACRISLLDKRIISYW